MNKDINGLERFIESACIDNRTILKAEATELKESVSKCSVKLRESIEDSLSEGWWVPVSFYNKENANKRNYNRRLWENVINRQRDRWAGAPMLVDHPAGDSDGSPKDICGIWLDAKLDKPDMNGVGLVYGLLVPSGRNGEDLKDHLKHGLKVGTSSSGFGKMLPDGVTVDPDSYIIERLSDWVLNPSQGTFFTYDESEDKVANKSDKVKESVETTNINIIEEKKFVKDEKNPIIAKMEEKKFRKDMEDYLEKASSYKDPQKRLVEFKDIKDYYETYTQDGLCLCSDLKEKVEEKIAAEEELIKTAIREKAELQENFGISSPKDLEEKLTKVVEDASNASKEARDWKEIAEKLQNKLSEANDTLENRPSETYVEFQKNKISELNNLLEANEEKAKKAIKSLYKKVIDLQESKKDLQKSINELNNLREGLLNELKENHVAYASRDEKAKLLEASLEEYKANEAKLNEQIKTLNEEKEALNEKHNKYVEESNTEKQSLNEKIESSFNEIKEAKENNEKLLDIISTQRESIEKHAINNYELKALSEKQSATIKQLATETREAQFKLFAESSKEKETTEKKSLNEVEAYYETLYKTYGNKIVPFKEKIINSRTLADAKQTFFRDVLQSLPESKKIERARIPESFAMSPNERAEKISKKSFGKANIYSKLPKGWI